MAEGRGERGIRYNWGMRGGGGAWMEKEASMNDCGVRAEELFMGVGFS